MKVKFMKWALLVGFNKSTGVCGVAVTPFDWICGVEQHDDDTYVRRFGPFMWVVVK